MMQGGGTAEVWEKRRVDVETFVFGEVQDARGYEEAEGYGDDEVDGDVGSPAGEGVDYMGVELELFGGYFLYGNCRISMLAN